jgi:hypothetical protein
MYYQDLLAMQEGIVAKKPVTCKSKFKIYATSHSAGKKRRGDAEKRRRGEEVRGLFVSCPWSVVRCE